MQEHECVDLRAIERLRGLGGEPFVEQMIGLFFTHVPERIEEARSAWAKSLVTEVGKIAHSVKSSAANVGAYDLRAAALELETAASEGRREEIALLLENLQSEFERVRLFFERRNGEAK